MRKLMLVVSLGFSLLAGASPIVKVNSYPCEQRNLMRAGSGYTLTHEGKAYVLTSSHVVFHGDSESGICHSVQGGDVATPAKLKAVNTYRGVALLEVDPSVVGAQRSLSEAEVKAQTANREAVLRGYPLASGTELEAIDAKILNFKGTRGLLPLVAYNLEAEGHTEPGMSGGALMNVEEDYLGLVSHHYLPDERGTKAPKPVEYGTAPVEGKVTALVIPAPVVLAWARAILEGKAGEDYREDVTQQKLGKHVLLTLAGIQWQQNRKVRFADGVGVGGEDQEEPSKKDEPVDSGIYLSAANSQVTGAWPFAEASWLPRLKKELANQSEIRVSGLVREGNRIALTDMMDFFREVNRGARPLFQVTSSKISNLSQVEQKALDKAKEALGLVTSVQAQVGSRSAGGLLLKRIQVLMEMVQGRDFLGISDEQMAALTDAAVGSEIERGWGELASLDKEFDQVVKLQTQLRELRDLLGQLRF